MPLEKNVKDIMRPLGDYLHISENEGVKRALELIADAKNQGELPHLLVVGNDQDEKEVIKGFITPPEIVFGMAGHFLKGAERIGPIFWDGQLKTEYQHAFEKRVGEIMTPIASCINGSEKLMEAVFLMYKYQLRFMPVVRCEEVIGMIHLEDILDEIVNIVLR